MVQRVVDSTVRGALGARGPRLNLSGITPTFLGARLSIYATVVGSDACVYLQEQVDLRSTF